MEITCAHPLSSTITLKSRPRWAEILKLLSPRVLAGHLRHVPVVRVDAFVEPRHFAEHVANDGVGPSRQILQTGGGLAAHGVGLQGQHDAELAQ